ncbi:MAG: SpoIVB peptidase [Hungatella sp.]|nr:SpoIVB peptidase [Hungatella sp.]
MLRKRRYLLWTFCIGLLACAGFSYYYLEHMIPDRINIIRDQEELVQFPLPFSATLQSESEEVVLGSVSNIPKDQINIIRDQTFSLYGRSEGSYLLSLDLFGLIRFKEIQVDVVNAQYAIPCGAPVGIYLKSKGVMVIGTGEITGMDGVPAEPAAGIVKSGDYIESINGEFLETKEQLADAVGRLGGQDAVLTIRRDEELMNVTLEPVTAQDGSEKLGIWVRSDTQGIGTMTYLDLNGKFGALGHGISDTDTGEVVQISGGTLYDTEIVGIEKGTMGNPGVMSGVIYYGPGSLLGEIDTNCEVGIFGTANDKFRQAMNMQPIEIGYRQDVKKGPAFIRSGISGEIKDYQIEILKVDYSTAHQNKSLVIQVTDPSLITQTGGIVQGMSGSPIIQDGKLIGAVTHVFIQDSTKGYGIFIENMLSH